LRELREETGIEAASEGLRAWPIVNHFDILPQWRDRYAPGVTRNAERLFSLCLEDRVPIRIAAGEHRAHVWLPWREAAKQCFSWTNQDAIRMIALDRAE
jgi:dATP pyrophosphohydrolase